MKRYLFLLLLSLPLVGWGQIITTFAGNGQNNNLGDGGLATGAGTNYPLDMVFDNAGNFYFSLGLSGRKIRKISPSGVITTVAGTGMQGYTGDGGLAVNATLNWPGGIEVDSIGNIFIAEFGNHTIRKVDISTGIITTITGNGSIGYGGDNGPASAASLNSPSDICFDKFGNLYIADGGNLRIRKINTLGIISTFAGTGNLGHNGDGGLAINAELMEPSSVTTDDTGNIYIGDAMFVRKVDLNGVISTVAGNGIGGSDGEGGLAINAKTNAMRITFDKRSEILYICENDNNQVRKVDKAGIITTVAGNGDEAFSGDGGLAVSAEMDDPFGLCVDSCGNLYIADGHNLRVRKVTYLGCNQVDIDEVPVSQFHFTLSPNPAGSQLSISSNNKIKEISITNTLGQVVLSQTYDTQSAVLDVEQLQPGIYFIKVRDGNNASRTEKFIKE